MNIDIVQEYNDKGCMLWIEQLPGAFVRGQTLQQAMDKLPREVQSYTLWAQGTARQVDAVTITHEYRCPLAVEDADGDVLFPSERLPMDMADYIRLKELAIRSSKDFNAILLSVPQKDRGLVKSRKTFYGKIPQTAREMVAHTNNTLGYYAQGIGIDWQNEDDLVTNRIALLKAIEEGEDFLSPRITAASDGELWTLKKFMRRLIWHDRIHARALYRKAISFWGKDRIANPFFI